MEESMYQLTFFEEPRPALELPDNPTAIIVSVSGGLDSVACALWARKRWPDRRLILWHAHLEAMDWPQTDAHLVELADTIGNCELISVQAVYALNGATTPTGANGTTLARLHTVRHNEQWFGPAQSNDPAEILTLLDFAIKARHGQPPTSKIRWCTGYFKSAVCDRWLRENKAILGDRAVLLTGERHAESPGRSRLPQAQLRFGTKAWDVLWYRPVITQAWHEVVRASRAACITPHPAYEAQGETMKAMLDPARDERGRARLSCVCCIFSQQHHIETALHNAPDAVEPAVARIQDYERATGYTWQQRSAMLPIDRVI
jgi:hypothetical protein